MVDSLGVICIVTGTTTAVLLFMFMLVLAFVGFTIFVYKVSSILYYQFRVRYRSYQVQKNIKVAKSTLIEVEESIGLTSSETESDQGIEDEEYSTFFQKKATGKMGASRRKNQTLKSKDSFISTGISQDKVQWSESVDMAPGQSYSSSRSRSEEK